VYALYCISNPSSWQVKAEVPIEDDDSPCRAEMTVRLDKVCSELRRFQMQVMLGRDASWLTGCVVLSLDVH